MKKRTKNILLTVLTILMMLVLLPGIRLSTMAEAVAQDCVTADTPGTQAYSLFNSGATRSDGYKYSDRQGVDANPDSSSYTNRGYDIYGQMASNSTLTLNMGESIYIGAEVTSRAELTIYAYDVDEEDGEKDDVFLVDETSGSRVNVGKLSGMDNQWNTTVLSIDADNFTVGHTYHFETRISDISPSQSYVWLVYIRTVSLTLTLAGEPVVSTIEAHDFTASISDAGQVSTSLYLKTNIDSYFTLEYKASIANNQKGSSMAAMSVTAVGATANVNFALEARSPEGTYQIDVIVKDASGNTVASYSCFAGYGNSAVTYDPNGGTNNVPIDANAYVAGDAVTVLFNYIPTRYGYEFLGWAWASDATQPDFANGADAEFVIGENDVTLYAVWSAVPVTNGEITVVSDADTIIICESMGLYQDVEFYYVASNMSPIKAMAITPIYDSAVFDLVSCEWLKVADLQNIEDGTLRSVAAWAAATDINGNVYKMVLRTKAPAASTEISAQVMVQDANGLRDVDVVSKVVSIVECPHATVVRETYDSTFHTVTCELCGYVEYEAHTLVVEVYDDTYHTIRCEYCDYIEYVGHDLVVELYDSTYHAIVCQNCDYVNYVEHTLTMVLYDDTYHAIVCGDCEYVEYIAHTFDNGCDTDCNDGCGYVREANHTYDAEWSYDAYSHWHACTTCGGHIDMHAHSYDGDTDPMCDECGYTRFIRGDFDDDGDVDSDDAIYLLGYYFFPNDYPINQPGDVDGDGNVDPDDSIYLLSHYFFPNEYPLH